MTFTPQPNDEMGRLAGIDDLRLRPSSATESTPVSAVANQQLAEILAHGIYPLVREYLNGQKAEAGTCLWREGDAGNSLALILSGKLETLKETEFPKHSFVTGIFSAGTVIGEDGFLDNLPRSTTVRVLNSCELLTLSRENFEQLEQRHPAVANLILKWLLNLMSNRLQHAHERMAAIF